MTTGALQAAADYWSKPDYSREVSQWAHDRLRVDLWSMQADIANSTSKFNKTYVRSCHDSGKTFEAAVIGIHHIDTHPIGESRLVTTAPTDAQVRALLWNEINQLFERGNRIAKEEGSLPIAGRVNQSEWWIGRYMAGIGRKPSDYKTEHFSGWHARWMLVIADEADGLPASMWAALDTLLTNATAKLLAIGNPDDPQSEFRQRQEAAGQLADAIVFRISAWDTPNFSGELVSDKIRDSLLAKAWVEERRVGWGEGHPFWFSKVEAEYPDEDVKTIVRTGFLSLVTVPADPDVPIDLNASRQLGVDVAGSEGGDKTVARLRVGDLATKEWTLEDSSDPAKLENWLVEVVVESGARVVVIDATGVGFGFVGSLRNRLTNLAIIPFVASGKAARTNGGKRMYENARAELWWEIGREFSRLAKWNLAAMENAEATLAELVVPRYEIRKGVIRVEPKDEVRRRMKSSPDHADALLLAFWTPPTGGEMTVGAPDLTLPTGAASVVHRQGPAMAAHMAGRGGGRISLPNRIGVTR